MPDELPRAVLPRTSQREGATGVLGDLQRAQAGLAQILVQHADRMVADHVLRSGDRIGRDRHAAGERFELHDAERVGQARKGEDIGSRDMRREIAVFQQAEELRLREPPAQLGLLRAMADDHLGAGQVERQEGFEVLLDRDPPDADEDRPRKVEIDGVCRIEQIGVDAARPHAEIGKAAARQFLHQRRRRDHGDGRAAAWKRRNAA